MSVPEQSLEAQLEELFHDAAELDKAGRRRVVEAVRREDENLAGQLEDLLAADSVFEDAELLPFQAIGPYRILKKIGEGGMGTVFLARQDEPIERDVALKLVRRDTDADNERFHVERAALARMDHPGIARVFDAGETPDGREYIAMEYVEGERITRHCDRHRLSIRERLELLAETCEAVQHAHQKGVLHRDLKPSNIQVTMRDGRYVPKVIDFGVAKPMRSGERHDLTRTGRFIGTPDYMSPEQAGAIPESVDSRTDVYSLGVVLYELLTGTLPHGRGSEESGMAALFQAREIVAPSARLRSTDSAEACRERATTTTGALVRRVRGDLDWITLKALAREPARRYASASELAADLRRYLHDEPILAAAPTALYRTRKWVARHRLGASLIVLLSVTLIVWGATQAIYNERLEDANADLARQTDFHRINALLEAEKDLWPPTPEMVAEMDSWLRRASEVLARNDVHRSFLRSMQVQAASVGADWKSDLVSKEWRAMMLEELDQDLERLDATFKEVSERRRFAGTVVENTIQVPAELWSTAAEELGTDARFDGFTLEPVVGFIPLGVDPISGLQEFAHLQSGDVPRRDAEGHLVYGPEHGLVFVLIPGGNYLFGDPREKNGVEIPPKQPRPTPEGLADREIDLHPYLISKFEMTQGQWERVTGDNPSSFPDKHILWGPGGQFRWGDQRMLPVESVDRETATQVLWRLGLELPTGIQYEIAARGDSVTGHWTPFDPDNPTENIGGAETHAIGLTPHGKFKDYSDGWTFTAPVGSLSPNPFGLYDVLGNVREITRGPFTNFPASVRAGDGLRAPSHKSRHIAEARGGSFLSGTVMSWDNRRWDIHPNGAQSNIGIRPALTLWPDGSR